MASKIFVDANVLLDVSLKREKHEAARELIQQIFEGRFRAYTTPSVIHITGHWLAKEYGAVEAKAILLDFLRDINIIDCGHGVVISALNSVMTDIEDALQYYTALHHKIDFFISRDKRLKQAAIPSLPVYFPEEFLADFI